MKRFIRYLYEYEEGRRIRNVGFVKVDQQEQECMIHIYGKGLHLNMGETLELYLFYEENGLCVGVWQGEITNINPAVNYRLHYTEEDTGEAENFSKIRGIVLKNHGDRKYAAVWDDMPADVEHMKIWERKEEPIEMEEDEEEVEEEKEAEKSEVEEKADEREELEDSSKTCELQEETEALACEPIGRYHARKIQRKELSRLPRCEWKLSNNQFLLHGYYNYHHLVFLEEEQMMYLGVPGIFHEEEAKAAGVFGFPQFIPLTETDLELPEEECEGESFGYWCRQICTPYRCQERK